jgi:hypothetical protein
VLSISGASEFTQSFFVEFVLLNLQFVRKDIDVSEVFCGSLFGFFLSFFSFDHCIVRDKMNMYEVSNIERFAGLQTVNLTYVTAHLFLCMDTKLEDTKGVIRKPKSRSCYTKMRSF